MKNTPRRGVAALVRQDYSGEEALALSLMPGDSQAFLSGGFNDMLQSKDVLTDAALRALGPRVYGGMERVSAGGTGAAMSSGTGRAALPGSDTPGANGSVLSPGTTPAAADSQSALHDSGLFSCVRNLLGSSANTAPHANPISDSLTAAARNLLDSFRGTVSRYAAQSREPLLAGGPQGYEENEPGGWIEESETEEPTQATNSTGKDLTGEQTNGRVDEDGDAAVSRPTVKLTMPSKSKGGKPLGEYERIPKDNKGGRGVIRQNESADLIASEGYEIVMLKAKKGGNGYGVEADSNPDFLIEGEAFDCYSPDGCKSFSVWSKVQTKTLKQARRIVLNLSDYKGSVYELFNQFKNYEIATLDEMLVIHDGQIIRWIP